MFLVFLPHLHPFDQDCLFRGVSVEFDSCEGIRYSGSFRNDPVKSSLYECSPDNG